MSQFVVRLKLPYPPSANSLWKYSGRSGVYRSPRYMQWLTAAGWEIKAQKPGHIRGNYFLRVDVERKDRRRRDIDNLIKSVSDALVQNGVVTDDSLAERITIGWSDKVSGCRVTVRELAA